MISVLTSCANGGCASKHEAVGVKTVRNVKRPDVMFRRKSCQWKDTVLFDILPSWLRVVLTIQSRIQFLYAVNYSKMFKRRNPPCDTEGNLHAEHIVIEDWFRGYRGSPGLGGPRCPGYSIWIRLMGCEHTKWKTFPRVRVRLPYAWMARLVSGYVISFLYKPTLYNPMPFRCVYKLEGLVRRGYQNSYRLDI